MIKNRFLALAVAVAMMVGTAVPAFADNKTTVSLTVAPKNTYTMEVPANTELNSDGSVKQLTDGIKITNGTLEDDKKLTVTATSKNDWYMVTTESGVSTKIGYSLYSDEGITEATTWEFTRAQANDANGTTKAVYAMANATDLAAAASGEYSDVITFTAEVKSAETKVMFELAEDSETYKSYSVEAGTTWDDFITENNIKVGKADVVNAETYKAVDRDSAIESGKYYVGIGS